MATSRADRANQKSPVRLQRGIDIDSLINEFYPPVYRYAWTRFEKLIHSSSFAKRSNPGLLAFATCRPAAKFTRTSRSLRSSRRCCR
jgi:hypothetical protein